jgi:UDP-N-acetyl-D-mannosaminuronic acid dehydrogenase
VSNKKIVVIGTGYVGLPAALMWAKSGLEVVGVDINENIVRAINEKTLLLNESELNELLADPDVQRNLIAQTVPCPGDVFVIAVPTPVHPLKKVADLAYVRDALRSIAPHLRAGNLVIIESTIPPLTTRDFAKPILEELTSLRVPQDILLAHCPERILPGDIFREIVHNDRLIGGIDEASAQASLEAYQAFVQGALLVTDDLSAELSKLFENTYRDVNIALANEFSLLCEDLGADVRKVISFANRHPRVNILSPGIGVGGHCIPVDPWFLKEVAPYNARIITTARLINDEMPRRMAEKIRKAVKNVENPQILALGATYKRNCEDMRESPATEIVHLLQAEGYAVRHYDPLVEGMHYPSLAEAAKGTDLLVVLVHHDDIANELSTHEAAIKQAMRNANILVLDVV